MTLQSAELDRALAVEPRALTVSLLDGFSIAVDGERVAGTAVGSQRLLGLLALRDRPVSRIAVSGIMWSDVTAQRAGDSLRSALARLDPELRAAVIDDSSGLELSPRVQVDYREARNLAHRLLDAMTPSIDRDLAAAAIATLSRELLPDWPDAWVVIEGDEWRHLRAKALEALATRLLAAARLAEAEGAARAAIRVDPLRETPHGILIRVQLAGGNQSDALQTFADYRALLRDALHLEPTEHLRELMPSTRD